MTRVAILASGASSALGEGRGAASAGEPGEGAPIAIARDAELEAAGLARPFVARAKGDASSEPADRATLVLMRAIEACARELDDVRPGWRAERVGLVLGTSSGGMRSAERFFDGDVGAARSATYFAPMTEACARLAMPLAPATLVLGACASSTIAIGLSSRWLAKDACDVVLAGGFDAVSVFVAAGFEVLRATSARVPPSPFRVGRDGMALGEGAAVLALALERGSRDGTSAAAPERGPHPGKRPRAYVAGFGASSDAVHLTAPDRTGGGLARAALAALGDAGVAPEAIDLVSAHATATPFNDPAEARAIERVLGDRARDVVVHPFKAQIGHTLGAAGALEALVCVDAIDRGVLPAAAGDGPIDPDARVRLLEVAERAEVRAALKLSAAFGGANAALVLTRDGAPPASARARRASFVSRAVHVAVERDEGDLARVLGVTPDRLARADGLTRLALAAVAELAARHGDLRGAGVVVGHALATLETNALFHARIRSHGARFAEPRRFPYTSPNAVAGECSLAFGCSGPSFAVGSGLHGAVEALVVASLLVESGDAERVVVVAVDELGDAAHRLSRELGVTLVQGAVATLVTREPSSFARIVRTELRRGPSVHRDEQPVGHRALMPLTLASPPARVEATSPPDARAIVELESVSDSG